MVTTTQYYLTTAQHFVTQGATHKVRHAILDQF